MTSIPKSEKLELAVALDYEFTEDSVPTVEAVGCGKLAKEMKQIARRYGVPVAENSALTAKLARVSLKQEIPPDSYQDVARILLNGRSK